MDIEEQLPAPPKAALVNETRGAVRATTVCPLKSPDLPHSYGVDPTDDSEPFIEIDKNEHGELREAREAMVQEAIANGLPSEYHQRLKALASEVEDIFRLRLDSAAPADFPPMPVHIDNSVPPKNAAPRKYNPRHNAFISSYCGRLLDNGLAVKAQTSDWISAPLLVKKAPPACYRFTVDLRAPNFATRKDDYAMPNLEEELTTMQVSTAFAKLVFGHAFWQLPMTLHDALKFAFEA